MVRIGIWLWLIAALALPPSARSVELNPSGLVEADGSSSGTAAFSFLKIPISARNIGLAATSLTTDEEATVIQGNPAGIALIGDYYYSLSHAEILGEFRHENLALTIPTEVAGSFGATANVLAATAFEGARDIDENPSKPTAYDMAFGFGYGYSMMEGRVSAGARLDLIRSSIDGSVAYGYGMNMGLLFLLMNDLRLAAVVKNLSHGVRYDTKTAPEEPLPLTFGLELGKPLLDARWSAQAGLQQSNEGIVHYYAGAEWRMIRYLVLRIGYDGSTQDRGLGGWAGLATGLGIKYDRLTLDYGYKAMGALGGYHAFTLNYSRKAKFRARDEVYLAQALEKQREGKYRPALRLARRAVAANPYNFKAQALAQKLQLDLDRMDETAIAVIYTANTDGRLASDWKDGRPVGGLARRKTKLLELKGAQGKAVFVDAGNLTDPRAISGQEKYVYGAYAQMPYDAINLASAEIKMGADGWDPRLPFLCSQKPLRESHRGLLSEKIVPLKRGGEIRILGALEPANVTGEALGGKELEEVATAVRDRAGDPRQQRILILLLNGNLQDAHRLAAKVPELDAIILSGEAQALGSPMRAGSTLICSPGRGGTQIGSLTFTLDRKGEIHSFRHFLIPLVSAIPEDPELEKFLSPVTVDPNKVILDAMDDDYRSQIFAYVHKADTGSLGKIFLRDMRTGRDYRIPADGLSCARPILGYGKNKLAFIGEDSSGAREVYAFEPGIERLDTLTHMGGKAIDIRWILANNALLAVYEKDGQSELYRIDPWSREVRNLSKGRFGRVLGFSITKAGDRVAINSWNGKAGTLWVTNAELESPLAIATEGIFLGSPGWNAEGDKLAFLALASDDSAAQQAAPAAAGDTPKGSGELRVFDFSGKRLLAATEESRVRGFSWSADGKRVFYSAGVNLADLNSFNIDSMTLGKVTNPAAMPRSEENPIPKIYGGRDGLLFESALDGRRNILWMDVLKRDEKILVDSSGYNSLK